MKEILKDGKVKIIPTDWRYSAAILGLIRYFTILGEDDKYKINDDEFIYDPKDITMEKFCTFLHRYYGDMEFHHLRLKNMLLSEDCKEKNKEINETLKANTVMKNTFKDIKYDGENKDEILELIEKNNLNLTIKTFEFKNNMYKMYCNTANGKSSLFTPDGDICRLNGFYAQLDRKGKSIGYYFQNNKYIDINEFDFVCFGFSKTKFDESIFINSNFSIKSLINTNNKILEVDNAKYSLIENIKKSVNFLHNNVEIITKKVSKKDEDDENYYNTLILTKNAINIFKQLPEINDLNSLKIVKKSETIYLNGTNEIINAIINNYYLDNFINKLLKSNYEDKFKINKIIKINQLIYNGGMEMNDRFKSAYATAMKVNEALNENKIKSFKEKLISAISVDDKDTVYKILLKLSNYSEVNFNFAYDIFDDYDTNKNVLYTFINTLNNKSNKEKGDAENE